MYNERKKILLDLFKIEKYNVAPERHIFLWGKIINKRLIILLEPLLTGIIKRDYLAKFNP